MKKIMFVCLGNICRSPLAHALMDHLVEEGGLVENYEIDSSGTSGYHRGNPSDSRMQHTAKKHGVHIKHRAQQLGLWDIEYYDYIFAMDGQNLIDILSMCKEHQKTKVHLLREFDPAGSGDVPDPYYGGGEGFEHVYDIALRSCTCILKKIEDGEL